MIASSQQECAGRFDDGDENGDDEEDEKDDDDALEEEDLESGFPSFAVAATVPYEGSDNDNDDDNVDVNEASKRELLQETNNQQSLQPISKSGSQPRSTIRFKIMEI
jgi:hypothetical protein